MASLLRSLPSLALVALSACTAGNFGASSTTVDGAEVAQVDAELPDGRNVLVPLARGASSLGCRVELRKARQMALGRLAAACPDGVIVYDQHERHLRARCHESLSIVACVNLYKAIAEAAEDA